MRESILARLARFTVRSCLKCTATDVPGPCAAVLGQHRHPDTERTGRRPLLAVKPGGRADMCAPNQTQGRLHGGAFMIGSPVSHRSITGRLAN